VRIVSDRNIPFVEQAFAELGEVVTLPAAEIDARAVRDADVLLCRTTIRVDARLLEDSKVRFVATATIGTDHMDLPWLESRGIRWASAPGSNAASVALWWTCALAIACRRSGLDLTGLRVGVVGVGHVGRRIAALAEALGPAPLCCDPPRARAEGSGRFTALDDLLPQVDVLSLHVPLSDGGPDATRRLLDAGRLRALRPGAIVVNACRGEVIDGEALRVALAEERLRAVLDVFPGEPSPDAELIRLATLATPHIAGHSLDGKVNGTDAIYRALCAFLGRAPSFRVHDLLPARDASPQQIDARDRPDADVVDDALRPHYDLLRDDAALREIAARPPEVRASAFRAYRDGYPARRELHGAILSLTPRRQRLAAALELLGATVPTLRRGTGSDGSSPAAPP
jgi:erythronate-4-phosphate dehydrogenase